MLKRHARKIVDKKQRKEKYLGRLGPIGDKEKESEAKRYGTSSCGNMGLSDEYS
jgi:hypothetical protein